MNFFPITETDTPLRHTLAACVPDLQRCCSDRWIVIGSAAARLAGACVEVADLDVLTSVRDARSLVGHWRERLLATDSPKDADRFRSQFARFAFPLPVEIMGGLEVASPDGWHPVGIGATQMAAVDGLEVPILTVDEQIRMLGCFGRAKDRLRVQMLENLEGT